MGLAHLTTTDLLKVVWVLKQHEEWCYPLLPMKQERCQTQVSNTNAATPSPPSNTLNQRLMERYAGDPEPCGTFLRKCSLLFCLQLHIFCGWRNPVFATINRLTGSAHLWGTTDYSNDLCIKSRHSDQNSIVLCNALLYSLADYIRVTNMWSLFKISYFYPSTNGVLNFSLPTWGV